MFERLKGLARTLIGEPAIVNNVQGVVPIKPSVTMRRFATTRSVWATTLGINVADRDPIPEPPTQDVSWRLIGTMSTPSRDDDRFVIVLWFWEQTIERALV